MSGDISPAKRERIWRRDRCRCFYCGNGLSLDAMTLDHRIPRAQGGTNADTNLVACCRACNQAKGNRSEGEWAAMPRKERKRIRRRVRRSEW